MQTEKDAFEIIDGNNDFSQQENDRLNALYDYQILDTPEEEEFDRLTQLAAIITEAPIALITLIDKERQWFKSTFGTSLKSTRRQDAICNYALQKKELLEIEDLRADARFNKSSIVTKEPKARFYAGYPLIDPKGYALGTLCILDTKSRRLNNTQRIAIKTLAEEAVSHILSRKTKADKDNFETLFMRSIDLVCIAGSDGFFKKVNPSFNIVLGWSNEELTEKPFLHFVHPDDKQSTLDEIKKLSNGFKTFNFSNRYITKSGEYKLLNWTANPDPQSGNIYAIAHDMTEITKSQELLSQAEKNLRTIFENSPDAIFIEDSNGNIIDVNEAAISLQGMSINKIKGSNIRGLVPRNEYLKIISDYKKLFLGALRTIESSLWSPLKGKIPVEITGKKIIYNNKPSFLLMVRDCSERKKLEEERANILSEKSHQREEHIKTALKVQHDERIRIAAEMHDDVGASLSRISILGHVIKRSNNEPAVVEENIEKILQSSKTIQESISEIIWAMNPKHDALENLVSYINYYSSNFLDNSEITLKMEIPSYTPSMVISGIERRNIFLIVKESLNNILKYSEASIVTITFRFNYHDFSISIGDNGIGFDEKSISRFSNGIQNMRQRARNIGAEFTMKSNKINGTIVVIQVPFNQK